MPERGQNIYIVDDDPGVCKALSRLMHSADYMPHSFPSGSALLGHERIEPDACIICDLFMPGMNGLEVLSRLKERLPGCSFIFISAHADGAAADEAKRTGAGFFQKPFDGDALLDAVQMIATEETAP
jgi:two-component system response regulator FixJ